MKTAIALLLTLLVSVGAFAQQGAYKISGLVTDDENGEPVIGAMVGLKGAKAAVITDINGEFTIKSPKPEATIEIRSVGYEPTFAEVS
ncbi:MAG: carboxypeptidase-like regulatory domain-containing protein, partial [Muribaculaceae bacterium]|nr:carboxypeptidase-like regulatory domain-containing protein [Muribaculaceae bacterium]